MPMMIMICLGTGHKVITRGGWGINEISSTYSHTLPKTYEKMFVTPFNVSEIFYTPPPPSIINSVLTFVLHLSIFRNSPVCDNSPTSCSGNHILNIFRIL